jgi:hypothetical protein
LSVVPVASSISRTPHSTAGTVSTMASASRTDWKFAESSRKITTTASSKPMRNPEMVCSSGGISPRSDGDASWAARPPPASARFSLPRRFAQRDAVNIGREADHALAVVAVDQPGMVPASGWRCR